MSCVKLCQYTVFIWQFQICMLPPYTSLKEEKKKKKERMERNKYRISMEIWSQMLKHHSGPQGIFHNQNVA